ncbi:hypothetical protein H8E77_08760 [bacterium]|nr:hypothetical protein [bacterium]
MSYSNVVYEAEGMFASLTDDFVLQSLRGGTTKQSEACHCEEARRSKLKQSTCPQMLKMA